MSKRPRSNRGITAVLLVRVSILGGKGNLVGVGLSLLVVLNLRNGMGLADITGNTQNYVIAGFSSTQC
jgi:rhamnose transport system permease protein